MNILANIQTEDEALATFDREIDEALGIRRKAGEGLSASEMLRLMRIPNEPPHPGRFRQLWLKALPATWIHDYLQYHTMEHSIPTQAEIDGFVDAWSEAISEYMATISLLAIHAGERTDALVISRIDGDVRAKMDDVMSRLDYILTHMPRPYEDVPADKREYPSQMPNAIPTFAFGTDECTKAICEAIIASDENLHEGLANISYFDRATFPSCILDEEKWQVALDAARRVVFSATEHLRHRGLAYAVASSSKAAGNALSRWMTPKEAARFLGYGSAKMVVTNDVKFSQQLVELGVLAGEIGDGEGVLMVRCLPCARCIDAAGELAKSHGANVFAFQMDDFFVGKRYHDEAFEKAMISLGASYVTPIQFGVTFEGDHSWIYADDEDKPMFHVIRRLYEERQLLQELKLLITLNTSSMGGRSGHRESNKRKADILRRLIERDLMGQLTCGAYTITDDVLDIVDFIESPHDHLKLPTSFSRLYNDGSEIRQMESVMWFLRNFYAVRDIRIDDGQVVYTSNPAMRMSSYSRDPDKWVDEFCNMLLEAGRQRGADSFFEAIAAGVPIDDVLNCAPREFVDIELPKSNETEDF